MQEKSDWFANCFEELGLPGSPWYQVRELVAQRLADRIRIEGLTAEQLAKVSKFVGKDFIKHYRLYETLSSTSSPTTSTRLTTDDEVQQLLKDLTMKAARDADCSFPIESSSSKYFVDMVNLTKGIFHAHLDKEELGSKDSPDTHDKNNRVEVLGQTVVKILQQDPWKLSDVIATLKGRFLPDCVRKYLYRLMLLKKRKRSAGGEKFNPRKGGSAIVSDVEMTQKKIREQFASGVKRGMMELKIKQATKTSISHLIQSSVIEAFGTNPGLSSYSEDLVLQQESCKVLNVLYTNKKKFEHYYVLWLFPLQKTLTMGQLVKENSYELAMWLDMLIEECIPQLPVINQIVLSAWSKATNFSQAVPAFKDIDLKSCLWTMGITLDQENVRSILQQSDGGKKWMKSLSVYDSGLNSASHPVILIRNWVLNLFVGTTSFETSLFIWDQLFMHSWSLPCLKRCCLVLIYCLAKDMTECKTKSELLELFSKGIANVELCDIAYAWKQLNELWPL